VASNTEVNAKGQPRYDVCAFGGPAFGGSFTGSFTDATDLRTNTAVC